jgi:ABC-type transport system involved in multi-copper enzyme maturation permease subunit
MTSPQVVSAVRWLVRDTFRQALASRLSWLMAGVTAVVIVFCLGVRIEGGEALRPADDIELRPPHGEVTLGFGSFRGPLFRDGEAAVRFLQLLLAEWVAGAAGTLLALVWTAGFVPSFLEPSAASVLLAKPAPRWLLLLGKYVGVLALVACQATLFVAGTWAALGLATGYWPADYLWCIPLLVLQFAAVYAFSVLLAVCTRSQVACVLGSVLFWLLCWGMNYGYQQSVALPQLDPSVPALSPLSQALVDAGYWLLPKPVDLAMVLHDALEAGAPSGAFPEWEVVRRSGAFVPELGLLTAVLFIVGLLAAAGRQLATTDY